MPHVPPFEEAWLRRSIISMKFQHKQTRAAVVIFCVLSSAFEFARVVLSTNDPTGT